MTTNPNGSVHAEEMPDVVPAVTIASGQAHGPGSDLYRVVWSGRGWRSLPRLVRRSDDERRCPNPGCRQIYPCDGCVRRSSWPY